MTNKDLIETIENVLPQTQCRQCGCDGCSDYARRLAAGTAPINHCATGGKVLITKLAAILSVPEVKLDPEYGSELPFAVAEVQTDRCIGCSLCATACPVSCITGTPKHLFAVIENECTGCALCQAVCPMDCIAMVENDRVWTEDDAHRARKAFEAAKERRKKIREKTEAERRHDSETKSAVMSDVMARVRAMAAAQKK